MGRKTRSAVVVDDEEGARLDLVSLLDRQPEIEVVGQAATLEEAATVVRRECPDVVFLDIRLDHRSGFELLDMVDVDFVVVFVTAYEEHAVRAFEVDAVDYLLKPVEPERLRETLARLDVPPSEIPAQPLEVDDWLFCPLARGRGFLRVSEIGHITAARDYTAVHTLDGQRLLVPKTMKEWEARLPRSRFLRIHRSALVNLTQIDRVEPWSNYTYRVFLKEIPKPLVMSRHYAKKAERLLK